MTLNLKFGIINLMKLIILGLMCLSLASCASTQQYAYVDDTPWANQSEAKYRKSYVSGASSTCATPFYVNPRQGDIDYGPPPATVMEHDYYYGKERYKLYGE